MDILKLLKKLYDWEFNIERCKCNSTKFIKICRKCGHESES